MITLEKNGVVMRVATELQASVFLRNGYTLVTPNETPAVQNEPAGEPVETEKPKRRTRRKKSVEE